MYRRSMLDWNKGSNDVESFVSMNIRTAFSVINNQTNRILKKYVIQHIVSAI